MAEKIDPTAHVGEMTQKIRELRAYGPVALLTRRTDFPKEAPFRRISTTEENAPATRTRIGYGALQFFDEDELRVRVIAGEETRELSLTDVIDAEIDRPWGRYLPLHGRKLFSLVVPMREIETPCWVEDALERGRFDFVETSTHPKARAVGVVRTYNSFRETYGDIASLSQAKTLGSHVMTFLISQAYPLGSRMPYNIITSRMGFDNKRLLTVRPPTHPSGMDLKHVEMIDLPDEVSDEALLDYHTQRLVELGNEPPEAHWPRLSPLVRDEIFLYMAHN